MFLTEKGNPFLLGANRTEEGYNFALDVPEEGEVRLLLYGKGGKTPKKAIPFPKEGRIGRIYAMEVKGLSGKSYEYNYEINGKVCQDPFAYSVRGKNSFGERTEDVHRVRCGFLPEEKYSWEGDTSPAIPYENMILYKLHVRGYTRLLPNMGKKRGTFSGLTEMIPYWQELGINAVELMPAYEFLEVPLAEQEGEQENEYITNRKDRDRVNYWGYAPGYYLAPKRAYCTGKNVQEEVQNFVKALHRAGMECIMEFYFPQETNPFTALRALQFWKTYYHIDGFHIQGEGVPKELILKDGVLSDTKIMLSGYDFHSFYGGKEPKKRVFAEYNLSFLENMRRFLKSDEGMTEGALWHVRRNSGYCGVVNFMTCQDGFTLHDLVSYNYKHNEENGENNEDGSSYNYSWNCGIEGNTRKLAVRQMRERQVRNAFLMMLLSQGIPMIYAGDEMGNSQEGNNNAWCQDNPIGWTDWKGLKRNASLLEFVKNAVAFRKAHPILHMARELKGTDYLAKGFPDISVHGERAWYVSYENTSRLFGIMYCSAYGEKDEDFLKNEDDFIYVGYNFHWEERCLALPNLPEDYTWRKVADTKDLKKGGCFEASEEEYKKTVKAAPRTIVVLTGRREAKRK